VGNLNKENAGRRPHDEEFGGGLVVDRKGATEPDLFPKEWPMRRARRGEYVIWGKKKGKGG